MCVLAGEIPQDSTFGVKDQDIRFIADQFAHDGVGSFFSRDLQFHDTVIPNLTKTVDSRSLEVGSKKLAEGGRDGRIEWSMSGDVHTSGIWLARNQ
jgi:hypothetical protein